MFNGLCFVNIELTNKCNKNCYMCGRRTTEKDHPEIVFDKEIDFDFLKNVIAPQIPKDIVIAFHSNGEPTLYSRLGEALKLFPNNIKCFDTNGKLLVEKSNEIIDNLDTLTLSTFEKDPESEDQFILLNHFLALKKNRKPNVIIRCLGEIDPKIRKCYEELNLIIVNRVLHNPLGSRDYKKNVIKPEIGFCVEILSHLVIDCEGNVSVCVRFDPNKELVLGNLKTNSLEELWNSEKRRNMIMMHVEGKRKDIPYCGTKCQYWGCCNG